VIGHVAVEVIERYNVRRWFVLLLVVTIVLGTGLAATPTVRAGSGSSARYAVLLDFDTLKQGGVGVIHVTGDGIQDVRARFLNRLVDFYEEDGNWYGLLSVDMDQKLDTYPVEVIAWFTDGDSQSWESTVEVVAPDPGFIRQDITLPADLGYLLDPELDRAERARLMAIVETVTPIHYWNGPFIKPIDEDFTSPFGAWRLYNGTLWGRHTGVDMHGAMGVPLLAPAAGRVVLAERLDIRGNYVLIDHGWGVYSGLAHMSEIRVTRGQEVRQGQIIGISGSTGRSSGPHIHWEVTVNGDWVDPVSFLEQDIP
jgi:hypothetical protein